MTDLGTATQEGPKGRAMRELGVPVYKLSDYDAVDQFLTDNDIPYHSGEGANLSLLGRVLLWVDGLKREQGREDLEHYRDITALALKSVRTK